MRGAHALRISQFPTLGNTPSWLVFLLPAKHSSNRPCCGVRYLLSSHADNTLTLYLVRSSDTVFEIDTGQRLYGHTSGVASVQVASRGKAVSLSTNGREVRVWELEGGVSEKRRVSASVRIQPTNDGAGEMQTAGDEEGCLGGFDDEKVVVALEGEMLLVYDFTR
jgi:WD40 repeat protein